jgi:hypothetical protein
MPTIAPPVPPASPGAEAANIKNRLQNIVKLNRWKGRLPVEGAEGLYYTWSPGKDGKSVIVSLHSNSYLPEAELLYVIRNSDGTVAEENVFQGFQPGQDLTDVWHTGINIEDGELVIQLVGPGAE